MKTRVSNILSMVVASHLRVVADALRPLRTHNKKKHEAKRQISTLQLIQTN